MEGQVLTLLATPDASFFSVSFLKYYPKIRLEKILPSVGYNQVHEWLRSITLGLRANGIRREMSRCSKSRLGTAPVASRLQAW